MNERNLIRDYAREFAYPAIEEGAFVVPMRGETAGKAFMALQNVLAVVEHSESVGLPAVALRVLREEIRKAFA